MATLERCESGGVICVQRGDTADLIFNLVDSAGVAFDGTGRSYLLSVNSLEDPPDNTTQLFQSTGTVATSVVTFPIIVADVLTVFEAFYDIQETDGSGKILTIDKGTFETRMDITKP